LQVLRKEKYQDAALPRQGKEYFDFCELVKLLSLPEATIRQHDKASIIRI
ncbi:hypothetical protein DBR06_SOUSAS27810017, partial [Sousa chinensis]